MTKLSLTNSDSLTELNNYRVFLYGDNRSGKTYFSATWPKPLFIVPKISANEMRALRGMQIPVVTFDSIEDCREQVCLIADTIARNRLIGPYVPRTIVIDNMTSAMMAWKDELNTDPKSPRLNYDGWAKLATTTAAMMAALHTIDSHTIWIAHSRVNKVKTRGPNNRIEEINYGGYTLDGQAKNILPSHCDLLLYAEATSTIKGPSWWIYTQKKDIWPAGFRSGPGEEKLPVRIGPSPHYDDFAGPLGLPSLEEAEAE